MGFNPFKAIKKAVKKVTKSDLGKLALGIGAYYYGPQAFSAGKGLRGLEGWKAVMPALMNAPIVTEETTGALRGDTARTILGKGVDLIKAHPYISAAAGTIGAAKIAGVDDVPDVPKVDDSTAHADYLRGRKGYLAEWAEWKADKEGISYEEALADLEANPMFTGSQGGRVKAQGGLFAGQMPGRNPGMNPMNQMNQGLGAPNLGSRSMGMTPGMGTGGGQMDPRMAQMLQAQKLQGARRTGAVPRESEDTELIQLIKMLTAMGFPMEQLRGRTKEELVEMLVAASGKIEGREEVVEGEAIEERNGEEVEAVEEEVVEAAQGGRIGYANGGVDDWYREYIAKRNERGAKYNPSLSEYTRSINRPIPMGRMMPEGGFDEIRRQRREQGPAIFAIPTAAAGGGLMRTGYALGTPVIPSKDGMQLDMRDSGGYQPHGKAEKHDDVRALLAQGEFVMTSDAVKGIGGGDRELGAKKMYNLMHNMEAIA